MSEYATPVNQYLKTIDVQSYERYIPNAFNDAITMLEKINKVIYQMNESNQLTNDMVKNWNDFAEWINQDGINQPIESQINELMENGTFKNMILPEIKKVTDSQLTEMSVQINESSEKVVQLSNVFAFPDKRLAVEINDTGRLQRAIDSINGEGVLNLQYGFQYQVTSLVVFGNIEINGNNATLNSVSNENQNPILKNKPATNCTLKITNLKFNGKNRAIELMLTGSSQQVGLQLSLYKCHFQGLSRVSDAIYLKQIDFVELNKINGANYDTFLTIESDTSIGERSNTQIHVKNTAVLQSNVGGRFKSVDKAVLDGFDVNRCSTGIILDSGNSRMQFNSCHVEHYGNEGYTSPFINGYGVYMGDDKFNADISFNNCTTFLPLKNAKAGFYLGQAESVLNNVVFDNCFCMDDENLLTHNPLELYGSYSWRGRFPYTNFVKTWKSTASRINGIIENTGWEIPTSKNILPFNIITNPSELTGSVGNGVITIEEDQEGIFEQAKLINITANGNTEKYVPKLLKPGWYTLLLLSYQKTGTPFITVQQLGAPYTTILLTKPSSKPNLMVRIPFYVSVEGTYKIGFTTNSNASFVLKQIEIVKGFGKNFSS